jgi:uncharacterized membrane protein
MDDNHPDRQAHELPKSLPFRAVLVPHRSLSARGFVIFMTVVGLVSLAAGMVFVALGAWPVLGFFGLDVLLIYGAFKLNYRAARATETVDVTRDDLTITRHAASGRLRSQIRLSSTWARVREHEAPDGSVALTIGSHGRFYPLARDLGSDERRSFARALRVALALVRLAERP